MRALECALALKTTLSALALDVRVTVVSMGIPATELLLRGLHRSRCRRRAAADRSRLCSADTLATTYALKCGIEASTRTSIRSSAARWRWMAIRPRLVPSLPVPLRFPA